MDQHLGRYERRNFVLNAIEGALFISSLSLVSALTVLPALVNRLGGGNVSVGAVGVIVSLGLFLPQIFAARYVETIQWKKPWTVRFGLMQRGMVLIIGFMILFFGTVQSTVALWLFLSLCLLNQVLLGITTPGWFDLFAKLTPVHKRGRLIGIRNALGGGGAFLCGFVLTWLLGGFRFPVNYALVFFLAFTLQFGSVIVQTRLVEEEPSRALQRRPMFAFLRELPEVFRQSREFKKFVATSLFLVGATMPIGFYTVYALRQFNANESVVGEFTVAAVTTLVVSALVNGYVADHYGNKVSIVLGASGLLCANVWALFAPSLGWFKLVYMFLGVHLGTELMARYNMSIEFGPAEKRSTYVGLMNAVLAPVYSSALIGGWMSDKFGYSTVFGAGGVLSMTGILLLVFRVRDPRSLQSVRVNGVRKEMEENG